MKKCPFCGADIEESARFCLYCMQSLTEKEQIPPHPKKKPRPSLLKFEYFFERTVACPNACGSFFITVP